MANNTNNTSYLEDTEFQKIVTKWGKSSALLRNYLANNDSEYNWHYAAKMDGINVNAILHPTFAKKQMLFGASAIKHLRLAMLAKAYIMNAQNILADNYNKYFTECLHLFLRINSTKTEYSFSSFLDDVNNAYNNIISANKKDLLEMKQTLIEATTKYGSTYVKTKYHYSLADFEAVLFYDDYKEAYKVWIDLYFPSILENYKKNEYDKFCKNLICQKLTNENYISDENFQMQTEKKKKDLDKMQINKLSYKAFYITLKRLKETSEYKEMKAKNDELNKRYEASQKQNAIKEESERKEYLAKKKAENNKRFNEMLKAANKKYVETKIACNDESFNVSPLNMNPNMILPKFSFSFANK